MANTPTVSIIIPNYNYSRFLDERFRSVLAQTYRDYEIIFLDDASTDNSVELIREKYSSYVTRLEINPSNSGSPFVQWNKGVRLSRGEYIWIAEADDTCAPDFLERAVSILRNNPSVGLVYCHTLPINTEGQILTEHFYLNYVADLDAFRWTSDFQNDGKSEVREYLCLKNTITNVSGVLFRRSAYIKAGYAPEAMRMCGDWMFYCRLLRYDGIAYISIPLNFHRQHVAKQTVNSVLDLTYFREFLQVQEYLIENFEIPSFRRRNMFHRFIREWDRLVFSGYGRIGLKGNLRIAQMTMVHYVNPDERFVIFLHFLLNVLKSMITKWLKK
ncbi:MAG: glycosyltransferase family 2 protein [Anaerolineae bacterium]|nr:MAG: glycosyltransferase family 2 protein [Anaerolineae bacterium]